jgi:beta-glucanase (GH16 family)
MTTTVWNTTAGTINYGDDGAKFTIAQRGDSPTVKTNFYLFFGQVEVIMKAASGQGIISSIVLESDDLDEVDWELMGGNTTDVETNYFGKGNTTTYDRAIYYPLETPQETWHNYTLDWSAAKIDWYIDGNIVRTLDHDDANGGENFPQTPMNLRLGIWAGGDPKEPNGTIEWAGGLTDYSQAPFTMQVKSVRVSDTSRGTAFQYGDTSGCWQSIKVLK